MTERPPGPPHGWGRPCAFALLLAAALLAPKAAASPLDSGLRLTRADARGVAFAVTTGEPVLAPTPQAPRFTEVHLPGFSSSGAEGEPALPARTVWIGVPEGVELSVRASALEVRSHQGVRVVPRVLHDGGGDEPVARLEALSASEGYRSSLLDTPLAKAIALTGLRAQRVAAIEIRPARYDALTGRLDVATRIAVEVEFLGRPEPTPAAPAEPAFEGVYRNLLLNYETARAFRRPPAWASRARRGSARPAAENEAIVRRTLGFDVASTWVRVHVERKGIHEILGADLEAAGVPTDAIDPAALRLFTRPGLPLLDEGSFCDSCGLVEVAIHVEDGGDGRLDADDRLLFFGLGASGWRDEFTGPGGAPGQWLDHPYETHNVYWLAWEASLAQAPRRWASRDVAPASAQAWAAPFYSARAHFEQNHFYRPNMFEPGIFWDQWTWSELIDLLGAQVWQWDTRGAVAEEPARLFARFWGQSQEWPRSTGISDHYLDLTFNDVPLERRAWDRYVRHDVDTTAVWIRETGNRLTARIPRQSDPLNASRRDRQSLLFWELHFKCRFQAVDDTLEFTSPDTTGLIAYTLTPFTDAAPGSFLLLDVTDPLHPAELAAWASRDTTGGKAVHFHDEGGPRFYFAASASRRLRPRLERAEIRDLRSGSADYLVICSDDLEPQAQRLADHRRAVSPPVSGAATAVVRSSDVLAWYAGGRMDPTAIRNFLYEAVTSGRWSPAPTYVCLFGDASYDFKNVFPVGEPGLAATQVPTFIHGFETRQYPSDHWLADIDLEPDAIDVPDLIVGRVPAANVAEANDLVEKIVAYDAAPDLGEWRNRILLVADDLTQGTQADPLGGSHLQQADSLQRGHTPLWLDRAQVHLIEYDFTQGIEKGGARQAVKRRLDEGAVFWHYIGHGSPYKLADESAFVLGDVAEMANGAKLPFFFAASCAVGPFDVPGFTSLAEALVKRPGGGTIASFAGTIETFADANFHLGRALYDALLPPLELGGARTVGEASFIAMHRDFAQENDQKYHVLGDPGTPLATPRLDVRSRLVDDETGEALGDSLPRGRRIRLEAEVHGTRNPAASALVSGFTGTASVRVTDSAALLPYPLYGRTSYYETNPRTAFRGEFPVEAGRLTARFVVPIQAAPGPRARTSVYVHDGTTDGSGAARLQVVEGDTSAADTTGPQLALRFASGGTVVGREEEMIVAITDQSGIFTLEQTPLDGIHLEIDGSEKFDLTEHFRHDAGSYTRGTVRFRLPGLADGEHAIRVTASDNLADGSSTSRNRSEAVFPFTVASIVDTPAVRAFALPNPFAGTGGTRLIFTGFPEETGAEVWVHTVAGRLVRRLLARGGAGHVQADWDGRDGGGRALGAGIYFYRAVLRPTGAEERVFEGRLVLLR